MQVKSYRSLTELDALEQAWNRLAEGELFFVPSFAELKSQLETEQNKFCLLVARTDSKDQAIACFIYSDANKFYHVGGKKLFALPARVVTLFGSCVLGNADESLIRKFFEVIFKDGEFDFLELGYIFVDSPLYKSLSGVDGAFAWRAARKHHRWWLIRLPSTFEEYLSALRERTRLHIVRDCRKFERHRPEFRAMHRADEVDSFLQDAVTISQRTYQWKLGYSLRNDEKTREQFVGLAKRGMFRGYVSYIDGKPCAYGWGDLSHGKFYFRQTGYDPQFRKSSPGTALMIRIIRDMIENTNCRIFHFQWGGEDGYKSRIATEGHMCCSMHICKTRPYPLLLAVLDQIINFAKNTVGLVVERGPLKARLRSTLRRLGVGTF